jgi:hypothetical protein
MARKTYERPGMVVYNAGDVSEWAVPSVSFPGGLPAVACGRSNPVDCHCTMGQARAMAPSPESLRAVALCHCASGRGRESLRQAEEPVQRVRAA